MMLLKNRLKYLMQSSHLKHMTSGLFATVNRNKFHLKLKLLGMKALITIAMFMTFMHEHKQIMKVGQHFDIFYPKYVTIVLAAGPEFNHENWPLFQHFVRLLSDPFVCIDRLCLSSQNDVLNLLAGAINPDRGRLRCKELDFEPHGNIQKFISWIKDHICCINFYVSDCMDSNHDQELLNFFLTGAHCTSVVDVNLYDLSGIVVDLVKKFWDFKKCDEYQLVQSIESTILEDDKGSRDAQVLKREYRKFIVKEEHDEDDNSTTYVFEFNNDDIEKKLQLTLTIFHF
ncbi:hypothetical protein Ddc_13682 [Ditylenchus destructor]|nr:hypothetical protein Ddc_13682 [Ditylenchus destructor]